MRVGGGGLVWKRRGRDGRNPMEMASRLGSSTKQMATLSGEMYPASGISQRRRERRCLADKAKEENVGNEMPTKANDRRRGADPPKNDSGRTSAV